MGCFYSIVSPVDKTGKPVLILIQLNSISDPKLLRTQVYEARAIRVQEETSGPPVFGKEM